MRVRQMVLTTLVLAGAAIAPARIGAHFVLMSPASWIVESDRGDPQKPAPCGTSAAAPGTPSNVVGQLTGGRPLHLKVRETIFHPGHYRVALAVNSRDELPPDPEATTREGARGALSVSAPIQNPVRPPLLADGLFTHTTAPTDPFEADIDIPNIKCEKCTLQVIEFMAEHGRNPQGDFSYHHCADVKITPDPAKAIDARWPNQR